MTDVHYSFDYFTLFLFFILFFLSLNIDEEHSRRRILFLSLDDDVHSLICQSCSSLIISLRTFFELKTNEDMMIRTNHLTTSILLLDQRERIVILKFSFNVLLSFSFRSLLMSTKNRDYDPMSEDGYDSKIPLHTEEAFQHGIHFDAKVKED